MSLLQRYEDFYKAINCYQKLLEYFSTTNANKYKLHVSIFEKLKENISKIDCIYDFSNRKKYTAYIDCLEFFKTLSNDENNEFDHFINEFNTTEIHLIFTNLQEMKKLLLLK